MPLCAQNDIIINMSPQNIKINAKGVSLKFIGWIISLVAVLISGSLILSSAFLTQEYVEVNETTQKYLNMKDVAADVRLASDYLTDQVRTFVITHEKEYMDNYFVETKVTKRRETALEKLHDNIKDTDVHDYVHGCIETAINESKSLELLEYEAMKLVSVNHSIDYSMYKEVENIDITSYTGDRDQEAINKVFGNGYMSSKKIINDNINNAISKLDDAMEGNVVSSTNKLKILMFFQTGLIVANIIFVASLIVLMHIYIILPMNKAVNSLLNNEEVSAHSNREFNYLAETYNAIHRQNENVKEKLKYEAEHDKLTGLYNRTGYDALYRRIRLDKAIYILLDIDKFKEVNDTLGHEMGDKVLIRTAQTIEKYFNDDNSYAFRIGGDEFAIIIENADYSLNDTVIEKCRQLDEELSKKKGNLPGTTLSIGVAHGEESDTRDTLFKKADKALYKVKNEGKADVNLYK